MNTPVGGSGFGTSGYHAAMELAIAESEFARGVTTPNPPVGAVIVAPDGVVIGRGRTGPAGGAHAEVVALRDAGPAARGSTVVVTLEPCNHTGRTPPCTRALIAAGVRRVVYAVADPNPVATGGSAVLAAAGIEVVAGVGAASVQAGPLRAWLHHIRTGRPHMTLKYAAALDGRIAAADGSSRWITGERARAHVHTERTRVDAIVVGTGTVLADDPWLTARGPDGTLASRQPVRVVLGTREIPQSARIRDDAAETRFVRSRDPHDVVEALSDLVDVQIEGGARVAGAFLGAGLVDRITAYIAPVVLGAGPAAVVDAGVGTIEEALRFRRESVVDLGEDLLLAFVPDRP